MSLDSRVAGLPYESSSFATSRGNESVTGLAFCVTWHDKHSVIGSLRSPPFPAARDFPLCRGQNKTLRGNLPICDSIVSTGYSATACGERWWRQPPKGEMHFLARQGGCMVFAAKGGIKIAPQRALTSPAQRYYITPEGGALNPSGRRQPVPDRTLAAQGRKARRLAQPSPAKAGVNLREYWKAPPRSRSRPTVSPGFLFLSIKKLPSRGKGVFFSGPYLMSYMPLTPSLRLM